MPELVRTIDAVVRHHAGAIGSKPMVVDPAARLTYAELDSSTAELAAGFIAAGVTKGSRVGLIMPNGVDWVRIAVALARIGAVLVPLSTLLRPGELAAQLRMASVQFLISVEEFRGHRYPVVCDQLPALRALWTATEALKLTGPRGTADALSARVRESDPMVIMFTSGSSGPPNGTIHSHRNALGAVQSGLEARCITADTRLYLPMPFFWVGGLGAGLLSALLAGATLVTEPIPQPDSTLELLRRERVTLFRGWPEQAVALARHARSADLSALRAGSLVRGATVYPSEVQRALRAIPGVRAATVVNVPDGQGNRVAAAVVGDNLSIEPLRMAAHEALSSFKVPTLWLLLDDEDAVPRGATGKIDNAALRTMLSEAGRP